MQLFIFARFHARAGDEGALAQEIDGAVARTRDEPGCVGIHGFRSIRDARLFYIHATWMGEDAFEAHAALPQTVGFIERAEALVDQPIEVTRAERMG
jgi:quinol monooxygenase YgiN